jgi:hypothetical protein
VLIWDVKTTRREGVFAAKLRPIHLLARPQRKSAPAVWRACMRWGEITTTRRESGSIGHRSLALQSLGDRDPREATARTDGWAGNGHGRTAPCTAVWALNE